MLTHIVAIGGSSSSERGLSSLDGGHALPHCRQQGLHSLSLHVGHLHGHLYHNHDSPLPSPLSQRKDKSAFPSSMRHQLRTQQCMHPQLSLFPGATQAEASPSPAVSMGFTTVTPMHTSHTRGRLATTKACVHCNNAILYSCRVLDVRHALS